MKRIITNGIVITYAILSVIALCPIPDIPLKYIIAWMIFAIINLSIITPAAFKKYYKTKEDTQVV